MSQRPLETVPAAFSLFQAVFGMQMHSNEWLIWSACLLCFSRIVTHDASPIIGPFRELKIRLFDRFGFVANRPRIRSVSVGPTSCVVDIRCSLGASFRSSPALQQREKPILIQALLAQSAVEAFDERIVCRLSRPAELKFYAMMMSIDDSRRKVPLIEMPRLRAAGACIFSCGQAKCVVKTKAFPELTVPPYQHRIRRRRYKAIVK